MKRRMRKLLPVALASMAIAAAPAQARVDEGGAGGATASVPQVEAGGFDLGDAAIGIGIGVGIGALAVGTSLAMRRQRGSSPEVAGPAAR
jgi:hypothetical protein